MENDFSGLYDTISLVTRDPPPSDLFQQQILEKIYRLIYREYELFI